MQGQIVTYNEIWDINNHKKFKGYWISLIKETWIFSIYLWGYLDLKLQGYGLSGNPYISLVNGMKSL